MWSAEELNQLNQSYGRIKNEVQQDLSAIPGVVGVSYGLKQVGKTTLQEFCIRVYVKKKKALANLEPEEVIPRTVKGVKTDVIEIPKPLPLMDNENRYRPVKGGIQISNGIAGSGTLGCIASENSGCKIVILSNFHVLYARLPNRNAGHPIYQPYREDSNPDLNKIGTIVRGFMEGEVDCAIAEIACQCGCSKCGTDFRNDLYSLELDTHVAIRGVRMRSEVQRGQRVYKIGKKTERTVGQIIDFTPEMEYDEEKLRPLSLPGITIPLTLRNQIVIQYFNEETESVDSNFTFSQTGDSGSVIIDQEGYVVGLLCAADDFPPYDTFANPIESVLNTLNITINVSPAPATTHSSGNMLSINQEGSNIHSLILEKENLMRKTPEGNKFIAAIYKHKQEVASLVNHCRPVTVTWHRNYGPAFLAHLMNNYRNKDYKIPAAVKGITTKGLLLSMVDILNTYGSIELRTDINRYKPAVESMMDSYSDIDEALAIIQNLKSYE